MAKQMKRKRKPGRMMNMYSVRPGFERFLAWTAGEAAEYSGLSTDTVTSYLSRGYFKRARVYRVGPRKALRVDAESFKRFLETGEKLCDRKKGASDE
jgi:hypothetical protein